MSTGKDAYEEARRLRVENDLLRGENQKLILQSTQRGEELLQKAQDAIFGFLDGSVLLAIEPYGHPPGTRRVRLVSLK